jgi:beta-glucosidase
MEAKKKKKGSLSKLFYAIAALLLVIALVATIACQYFSGVLDVYVGLGEAIVTVKEGAENWDSTYYTTDYSSAEEIDVAAKATTKEIASEGITLMKNSNNTLPLKTSATGGTDQKISLFGRRSVDTVWGGNGSGAGDASQCTSLSDALTAAGYQVNPTLTSLYADNLDQVEVSSYAMDNLSSTTYYIGEFPQSYYTASVTGSYSSYQDAAIVVFGRQGGEGMDFCTDLKGSLTSGETAMDASVAETANYQDGQHQLELSYEERQLLAHVEENFDKVIVVINSANVMELGDLENDENVDAIVWMAYPGSRGTEALAEVLNGTVTPSGHTVDTWPSDLTADPTFPNTTTSAYTNVDESNARETSYMVEYEEGIYVGYRYYETADAEGTIDYDSAVVYPFGYGLSYTTFAQQITDVTEDNGVIAVTVQVTNTGDTYSGKDVVQIYCHAPYTGMIEKAEQVLVGYAKSDLLAPGDSQSVTVTFGVDELASYDAYGQGCYVLEAGEYELTARQNAHQIYGEDCTYVYTVPEMVVYDESNPRPSEVTYQTGDAVNLSAETKAEMTVTAAVNQFAEQNEHFVAYTDSNANNGYGTNFTRSDFAASFPTAPTAADLTASDAVIANLGDYQLDYYDSAEEMPTTGADNGVNAVALRGLTYDDPLWDTLLDQLTVKDMTSLIYAGNQGTVSVTSIGLLRSSATDGPAGLKQYGGLGLGVSGNFNCCGTLVAATWNVALAEAYGISVGNEAVEADVNGWYAPGTDLHRTAFGGRNFEYYSEDPLISGYTCAYTIQGAASKGLTCYFKHFALNDVETHREDNAPCVWANEQAMRELYLKAFEIAITTPVVELKYLDTDGNVQYKTIRATTGIMSSFNRIGSVWTGACKELVTNVLRNEWGFIGTVITDYNDEPQMDVEAGVVAGNDLMLANASTLASSFRDTTKASTVKAMRQAVKNIVYTQVNSNTVNGTSDSTTVTYGMAPWRMALYAVDAVLVVLAAVLIFLGIKQSRKTVVKVDAANN